MTKEDKEAKLREIRREIANVLETANLFEPVLINWLIYKIGCEAMDWCHANGVEPEPFMAEIMGAGK